MNLTELMVYTAIMAIVAAGLSSFGVYIAQQRFSQEKDQNLSTLKSNVVQAIKSPQYIKDSLAGSCIINPTAKCNHQSTQAFLNLKRMATSAPGQTTITGADGSTCYSMKGQSCGETCDATCPIVVETKYRIICTGGTSSSTGGTRNQCPSGQATLLVEYSLNPIAGINPKENFKPIKGVQVVSPKNLWGSNDVARLNEGAAATELTERSSTNVVKCVAGTILVGLQADGTPECKSMVDSGQHTCPAGKILGGYEIDPVTKEFKAICRDFTCPGNQVLTGFDSTGAPICTNINPGNDQCDPGTAASPTGIFMTGISIPVGKPICRKKTCLPGEIFARYNADGSAFCVTTSFIPRCPAGTCYPPPDYTPPSMGTFYNSSLVPLGYDGFPWVTVWSNGEPLQGYRMTYKNFTAGGGSLTVSNLFTDSLGAGTKTCQIDGAIPGPNHTCEHSWTNVTRAKGDCGYYGPPPNVDQPGVLYAGSNVCQNWTRNSAAGCKTADSRTSACPIQYTPGWINPNNCSDCGNPGDGCCQYKVGPSSTFPSEINSTSSETLSVDSVNFGNGSSGPGTATCRNSNVAPHNNTNTTYPSGLSVGSTFNHSYNVTVRASCNYTYTK